jgi:hypothetical protein
MTSDTKYLLVKTFQAMLDQFNISKKKGHHLIPLVPPILYHMYPNARHL